MSVEGRRMTIRPIPQVSGFQLRLQLYAAEQQLHGECYRHLHPFVAVRRRARRGLRLVLLPRLQGSAWVRVRPVEVEGALAECGPMGDAVEDAEVRWVQVVVAPLPPGRLELAADPQLHGECPRLRLVTRVPYPGEGTA